LFCGGPAADDVTVVNVDDDAMTVLFAASLLSCRNTDCDNKGTGTAFAWLGRLASPVCDDSKMASSLWNRQVFQNAVICSEISNVNANKKERDRTNVFRKDVIVVPFFWCANFCLDNGTCWAEKKNHCQNICWTPNTKSG
jgi:hypothetical protein